MECDKIKELIPRYFNHSASEEEIKMVEEHLCVCHDCRTVLGELMDKEAEGVSRAEQQPSDENKSDQMQIFSYDDIANIPQSEQPAKDEIKPEEETPKEKKDAEYFPAKDFEDILKKPPEPVEGVAPDETNPNEENLPPISSSDEPSDEQNKKEDKKEKIIQTPLGPLHVSDDDETSEEESALPPEKKDKVIQTPLGPISLSSEVESSAPDRGLDDNAIEKKESQPAPKAPEKFKPASAPKPAEDEIEPILPEPGPVAKKQQSEQKEEEIQEIGDKNFSFQRTSKFELDKTPIPSDKSDAFGYILVAVAILALLFVVYLFVQMKG